MYGAIWAIRLWVVLSHAVIVPSGHDLEHAKPLTLEAIAEWPLITYDSGFTGRPRIDLCSSDLTESIVRPSVTPKGHVDLAEE